MAKNRPSERIKLGEGIYTASDVAKILRIPYRKANYWFNGWVKTKLEKASNYRYYFKVDGSVGVNFFMLLELYVFHRMRENHVPLARIIDFHKDLTQRTVSPYPFANTRLLLMGKTIFIEDGQNVVTPEGELGLRDIVVQLSERIGFNDETGVAERYYPLGKQNAVVVSRRNQLGQPVIANTNIKASTLYNLHLGGESADFIARLYDLEKNQVNDAIEFYRMAA